MTKIIHRSVSCLLACLMLLDPGTAIALCAPDARSAHLPEYAQAYEEQAVVAGLTPWVQSLDIPAHLFTIKTEAAGLGLLGLWKPVIPRLQAKGWSDTQIVGVLGGTEEFLFSGALVSLGSLLLTRVFGVSFGHALEITSFISGILFPLTHWKERYRLVAGQLTLAPPNEKKKDMLVLATLGAVLRLAYALPVAHLPFGPWNILTALSIAFLSHAAYNSWIAPRMKLSLGMPGHDDMQGLEMIHDNEVAVSSPQLKLYFVGNHTALLEQLLARLGPPTAEALHANVEGISFTQRLNHRYRSWTFDQADLERLRQVMRWNYRESGEVSELQPQELSTKVDVLEAHFIGNRTELAQALNARIDQAASGKTVVELSGIRFERRMSGTHRVWAFREEDVPAIAKLMGWRLWKDMPGVQAGERNVSLLSLRSLFARISSPMVESLNVRLNRARGDGMTVILNGITFRRRLAWSKRVWTFQEADAPAVGAMMNWTVLVNTEAKTEKVDPRQLRPDEMTITQNEMRAVFVGDPQELSNTLNARILAAAAGAEEVTVGGIVFHYRVSGRSHRVWATQKSETPKLAALMGWTARDGLSELPDVETADVVVSIPGFKPVFAGSATNLTREMNSLLETAASGRDEAAMHGVIFHRKKVNFSRLWTFPSTDVEKLSEALQWPLKNEKTLQPNEIPVTSVGLKATFVGDQFALLAVLRERIHKAAVGERTIDIDGIHFSQRLSPQGRIWSFHKRNTDAVAAMMGWTTRASENQLREVQKDEIHVTMEGILPHFIGDAGDISKAMRDQLDQAAQGAGQVTVHGIAFNRRRSKPHQIWTYAGADMRAVAAAFGLRLRSDDQHLEKLAEGEVGVYDAGLQPRIIGLKDSDIESLNRQIQEVAGGNFVAERWGVTFRVRLAGHKRVWAFAEEAMLTVAQNMDWKLRAEYGLSKAEEMGWQMWLADEGLTPLQPDELAITQDRIREVAIGAPAQVSSMVNGLLEESAAGRMEVKLEGVVFRHRAIRGKRVWACAQSDFALFAQGMGLKLRTIPGYAELKEDEAAVSLNGLRPLYLLDGKLMLRQLDEHLSQAPAGAVHFIIGGVSFRKASMSGNLVWAFNRSDTAALGRHMGWTIKSSSFVIKDIRAGEIAVTTSGLQSCFIGFPGKLARNLRLRILNAAPGDAQELELGGIRFWISRSGTRYVWTFAEKDLPLVAQWMGYAMRSDEGELLPPQPGETVLTGSRTSDHFVGSSSEIIPLLQRKIDDQAGSLGTREVTLGGIRFRRRISGAFRVWVYDEGEAPRIAQFMGWTLRDGWPEQVRPDEIKVSSLGLIPYFIGHSEILARQIQHRIRDGIIGSNEAVVDGIHFYLRMAGSRHVWTFHEKDLPRVAALTNWKQRREAAELAETLGLDEAIALLGDDPSRLKQYIQIYHPELAPEDVDSLAVVGSMKGLRSDVLDPEDLHRGYSFDLQSPIVDPLNLTGLSTSAHAFKLEGLAPAGVRTIQVTGAYTRKISVRQDGTFNATLPLPGTGEPNSFWFYAVQEDARQRSPSVMVTIHQTGVKEDRQASFLRLLAMRDDLLEAIRQNPARYHFLLHSVEQSLLKQFTYGEDKGFAYLAERIRREPSPALRSMLQAVQLEFRNIAATSFNIRRDQKLYFFQKYTIYKAHQMLNERDPVTGEMAKGVIIANEQGLGKTVTALVLISGKEALVITPNSVVSTWGEQEEKFMTEPRLEILQGSYQEREQALKTGINRPQVVTNVEFMQGMTSDRAQALSKFAEMLVVDEADYLGRMSSQQTRGTHLIDAAWRILLTATPFKRISNIGNLLRFLYPDDNRFHSPAAFAQAFPADKTDALNTLSMLIHRHTIRIRKRDVFEEYDASIPLSEQSDRLPRKIEVDPSQFGQFILTREQCDSIKELFTNYQEWCRRHKEWVDASGEVSVEDRKYRRFFEGFFPKLHALRQIMNDPAYMGRPEIESPKHQAMDRIVHRELGGDGQADHKVIIFCRYVAEVEQYLKRYAKHGALGYYGGLAQDSNGFKVDGHGSREYYAVDEYQNVVLQNGKPVKSTKALGRPILAQDYSRLLFQNDPHSRVLVATYDTGALGVTLTGAHAVIDDDLASTYRDQYQSDDRAHRIDEERKKYAVRYYRLQAIYPENWLTDQASEVREQYFEMGTYDQIQTENLKLQARIFHRVMDGVGDESELTTIRQRFLANRMPFLFKGADAQDTEEATAPENNIGQDEVGPSQDAGEEEEGGTQGLLGIWKHAISWLQERGWSDTRIAGVLGGTEEFLFSGVLVGLGSLLLTHIFGVSPAHALELTSIFSGILFPLTHWNERYRLVGGQFTLAPPAEKKKDLAVLSILGTALRLVYLLPLTDLPFGHWNILIALPLAFLGHAVYNAWVAPRLRLSLGMLTRESDGKSDIQRLGPDEVAISQTDIASVFGGRRGDIARKINQVLEEKSLGSRTVTIEDVVFSLRLSNNGHPVWSFRKADKTRVGELFGLSPRAVLSRLDPDQEASVAGRSVIRYFLGDGEDVSEKIRGRLDTEPPDSQNERFIGSARFFRRLVRNHELWAFRQDDAPIIAAALGLVLRETLPSNLGDDEVGLTPGAMYGHFLGDKDFDAVRAAVEAAVRDADTVTLHAITFFRRIINGRPIWAFSRADIAKVGDAFNLMLRPSGLATIQPDDVSIVPMVLRRYFVEDPGAAASDIVQALEKAAAGGALQVELDGMTFTRHMSGSHFVWTFKVSDLASVARHFDFHLKLKLQKLRADEIAVTGNVLTEFVRGSSDAIAARIQKAIEGGREGAKGKVVVDGITFHMRLTGVRTVWAFHQSDLAAVAQHYQLTLRDQFVPTQIQDGEVAVSSNGLADIFIGDWGKMYKGLQEVINAQADGALEVLLGAVHFVQRVKGTTIIWAFKHTDRRQVASYFKLPLREDMLLIPLGEDEVAVSHQGLTSAYVGTGKDVTTPFREALPPVQGPDSETTWNDIRFFKRRAQNRNVWAFKRSDIRPVAERFGLTVRTDPASLIEALGLEEVVVLLGDDPLRLKQYIQLYHPDLAPEDVDSIATARSKWGTQPEAGSPEDLHSGYEMTLPRPAVRVLELPDLATNGYSFKVEGRTEPGVRYLQVTGAYSRRMMVRADGSFTATLPLPRMGQLNRFSFYAVKEDGKQRGLPVDVTVHQTGIPEASEAAFLRLLALKEELLESIRQDPDRYAFLLHALEQSLLRHFTYGEDQGFYYLRRRIEQENSSALRAMLEAVLNKFREIATMPVEVRPGQKLYFFQKYTVYEIVQLMEEGAAGVIVGHEQGLGKTLAALVVIKGKEAVVITPNSVVSTWSEQEAKFMTKAEMEILEGAHVERERTLATLERRQLLTNVEFTQGMTERRAELLSRYAEVLVIDEADYLGRRVTQQSKGTRMLQAGFRLLLSATPFTRIAHIGNLLGFLLPNDPRFGSPAAFEQAFPANEPGTLNALFLLMQRYTLRVRKRDVFEEFDPDQPLSAQSDRLPRRIEIAPSALGQFTLLREQCQAIKQLFTNYQGWCQTHGSFASTEDRRSRRYKEGFFSKLEALRQIMNDPAYIGRPDLESPKHRMMDKIVRQELEAQPERKMIIFCKYVAEVEKYLKRYEGYGALGFYGGVPRTSEGYKIDGTGEIEYFQVDDYENVLLKDGKPVPAADKKSGRPIRALDYQRLLFQNDSRSRILVATYDTGAVGVNLTAADVVVDDDLAPAYRDQYQSDDRARRIDNTRKKYDIRYYRLQAHYPKEFLDSLADGEMDYFSMGTYDQVHSENLKAQSRIFHRIMDGVGDESELNDIQSRLLARRMPFLFKGHDAEDTEASISEGTHEGAEPPADDEDRRASEGLLRFWTPIIPWLQERGWSDTRIAAVLGGSEEILFSGVLVSLGSLLLIHVFGLSPAHGLEITSIFSGIVFPLTHWKERYRLVGGQITLAPPDQKKKDLAVLSILGTALRLLYLLPLTDLPFGHWNILIALPLALLGHAAYNAWIAPHLDWVLGVDPKWANCLPMQPGEIAISGTTLGPFFIGNPHGIAGPLRKAISDVAAQANEVTIQGITFIRRKRSNQTIWTFKETEAAKVAQVFDLNLRVGLDIKPLGADEIAVSNKNLTRYFLGKAKSLGIEIQTEVDRQSAGAHEITVRGVRYIKRQTSSQFVWAFAKTEALQVAANYQVQLRSEFVTGEHVREQSDNRISAPRVAESEISCSEHPLRGVFTGNFATLVDALRNQTRPDGAQTEITIHGVRFFRREVSGHLVWAFDRQDIDAVARAFGFAYRSALPTRINPETEIPVTGRGILPHFVGDDADLAKEIVTALNKSAKGAAETRHEGVRFARRVLPTNQIVWTFDIRDLHAIARVFKFTLRATLDLAPIRDDETGVTVASFHDLFLGNDKQQAGRVVSDIEAAAQGQNEAIVHGVVFTKRKSHNHIIWTFKASAVDIIRNHYRWIMRADPRYIPLAPDEMGITDVAVKNAFIGSARASTLRILNAINAVQPGDQSEAYLDGIHFFRRWSHASLLWAIQRDSIPALGERMGLALRSARTMTPLEPDEVAVSGPSLREHFLGKEFEMVRTIQNAIDASRPVGNETQIDDIPFVRRTRQGLVVWAFNQADIPRVQILFALQLRSQKLPLAEDEIPITYKGLTRVFVGQGSHLLETIGRALPSLNADTQKAQLGDVFIFTRWAHTKIFWAFHLRDKENLAGHFGLTVRKDAEMIIEDLGLEEAIALLGDDPLRFKQYLQLYHPELTPDETDSVTITASMRGLRGNVQDKGELHRDYDVTLAAPAVTTDLPEHSTAAHAFKISGRTVPGVRYIQVTGAYTRRIVVRQDGTFNATLPVTRTGERNPYFFYPVKEDTRERGETAEMTVHQTGTKEDTETAFLRLLALREEVLESIKINPARYYFLLHSLEQSLLRHFTYGEDQGFAYLAGRIRAEQSKALKEMLRAVESEFRQIAAMPLNIQPDQRLYFFQKYTIYKANHLLTEPDPVTGQVAQGVIIANEQGLGKTVTALVIIDGKEAVIITPNSVVSTWAEQEEKFMPQARMEILEGTYAERLAAIATLSRTQVATNVEFTQGMTEDRAAALSNKADILVIDEADYLGRLASQQSKGTRMIKSTFRLLLTATPFKKVSHIGNLLGFLYPNDPRFGSTRAFARAFPVDNPESLNALFLLMQRHTIRVRKKDVFEEYDPAKPLSQQSDRLPRKVEVDPAQMGRFSLLKEQCDSIRQLFTDYQAWCQAHRVWVEQAGATPEDKKYKRFNEGFFPKLQALRQIMNDPAYFGQPELESPKHVEMDRIIHHELDGDPNAEHKVIIFCKYVAEVEAYLKRYESYGAIGYYGELLRDNNGYKIDTDKNREYYEVDSYENFVLRDGRPIKSTKDNGRPIRAQDYQRLLFQNDPKSRVLVATYDTGSVGVTLTGAHAVIDDDLAPTYRDQYQSDDRAHRIDNDRKKYEVRYYRLQATYPESWLKSLDPELLHDYFEMGTYDQVQYDNLRIQSRIFHRIMDGVGDESELVGIRKRFLANRMPFLFKGTDALDTEEATAPELIEGQDAGVEAEAAGEVDAEDGSQGLLSIWKPLIPWLQERGWPDTRIAGVLGGSEEFLFSGVLVSLGSLLLTHVFGINLTHALEITSFISGILFPLSHWKERYRLVGGQLTIAPPREKKKDLLVLSILGAVLRLAYALPLTQLPIGQWNILAALSVVILSHTVYNAWLAPLMRAPLGMAGKDPKTGLRPARQNEMIISEAGLAKEFVGGSNALRAVLERIRIDAGEPTADSPAQNQVEGIRFIKRMAQNKRVSWVILENQIPLLASRYGIPMREELVDPEKEGTVAITTMAELYLGNSKYLARVRARMKDDLEAAHVIGQKGVEIGGVLFTQKKNGKHTVWAFDKALAPQIALHYGLTLRTEKLAHLDPERDVAVTIAGFRLSFVQNMDAVMPALHAIRRAIEAVHQSGQTEVTVQGIRYYLRRSGEKTVWAFDIDDLMAVAGQNGLERVSDRLPIIDSEREVGLSSNPQIKNLFIGSANIQERVSSIAQEIEAANKDRGDTITVKGVLFKRRRSKNHKLWSFPVEQIEAFSRAFQWSLREHPDPESDIIVSARTMTEVYVGHMNNTVKAIDNALAAVNPQDLDHADYENIHFHRKQSGPHRVWTFKRSDIQSVAAHFNLSVRNLNLKAFDPAQEVAITGPGLAAAFAVSFAERSEAAQIIRDAIAAQNPEGLDVVTMEDVRYSRRQAPQGVCWSFERKDSPAVARLFALVLPEEKLKAIDHAREIPVSLPGLQSLFKHGPATRKAVAFINDALEKAERASSDEAAWNGIPFHRRTSATTRIWAFSKEDREKVRLALGLEFRDDYPEIDSELEIAISLPGLGLVLHDQRDGFRRMRDYFRALDPGGHLDQVELDGIVYQKRRSAAATVWTFQSSDIEAVAARFGLDVRKDVYRLIEDLGLEEAISLLGDDPLRLKQFIQLYHPELAPEDVDAIAAAGTMRGLRGDTQDKDELHRGYDVTLPAPSVIADLTDHSTTGHAFKLSGKTVPGVRYIQVIGAYTRRIVVRQDGTFSATLPIPRTGEPNQYFFYPAIDVAKERGEATELLIHQTGTKEDTEAAFLRLLALKEEVLESIKINPARYYFLLHSLEQSLLRHFTYGEDLGFAYLAERIRQEQSKALKEMLRAVESEFRLIAGMRLNIQANQRLYFFQKYTAYKANQLLTVPDPVTGQVAQGVIIANEQGLGKTVTALVIINGKEAVIITPNSVVSTWAEQEEKFMPQARMEILEGTYAERLAAIATLSRAQVATNVEFTQGMTEQRAAALSNKAEILVVDEADYLGRLASQQSKGTRMIKSTFRLLLTATPFKKVSHIGNLLGFLYPNDPRFGSTRAFARAFPVDNPESLNALFLLMQRHTIRVRKKDVFEEYDRAVALTRQSDRLPKKVEVDPAQMGRFSLLKEQCDSIRQLFTDYQAWCQAHRVWVEQAGATPEDKMYKRFNEGFFPKLQALRQIMNDPAYFGQPQLESPKHREMDKIVHHELDGDQNTDQKVIIFCKYVAEVEAYLKRFESYGAIGYYGELPRDNNGYKIDAEKNREYYEIDSYENFVLRDGRPIKTGKDKGRPIRALDYQRILFQNNPRSRILVATYDTGSVGVTLTGAHAVIDDDLAPTYRDQYQADDRAHRIDNDRKKYEVRYYRLQATYPESWLKSLDPELMHDYFEMGTYDQVQYDNLRIQSRIFHRIMDGVGDESELAGIRKRFLANRMPFLFKGTDAQDTEDATAPEIIEGQDAGVEAESAGEVDEEGGRQGLLSIWKPLIPWLQERGWSDTRIAGILGGSEEFLFSGVLVSLGSLLLTHVFGISPTHALEIMSFISGIVFPLSHWKERYRLVGGQLALAPPNEKKKDLITMAILGTALRLLYALPLADLPFGHWNTLIALPLTFLGHAAYNAWIATKIKASLAMVLGDRHALLTDRKRRPLRLAA